MRTSAWELYPRTATYCEHQSLVGHMCLFLTWNCVTMGCFHVLSSLKVYHYPFPPCCQSQRQEHSGLNVQGHSHQPLSVSTDLRVQASCLTADLES